MAAVGTNFFEELGAEAGLTRLVDLFYDLIEQDSVLRHLFPEDMTEARQKQALYFIQHFGGPDHYTRQHGKPFLRFKHRHAVIGQPERDAWMACFEKALADGGVPQALARQVLENLTPLADAMINSKPGVRDAQYFNTPT